MEEAVSTSQRTPKLKALSFYFGLGFCACLIGGFLLVWFFLSYIMYHTHPFIHLGITCSCLIPSLLPFVVSERHTLEQEVSKTDCIDNDVM